MNPFNQLGRQGYGSLGNLRLGYVQAVSVQDDGVPVADVVDAFGGVWLNCRFLAPGGGGASDIDHAPPAPTNDPENFDPLQSEGAEVVLLFPEGPRAHPWVLGTSLNAATLAQVSAELDVPADEADYPSGEDADKFGPRDRVIEKAGVRLLVSEHGIVIDTKRADKPVRIQLPEGQFVRVSIEEEADERLLLATATRLVLDAIIAQVNLLTAAVSQVEDFANQQTPIRASEDGAPLIPGRVIVDPNTGALAVTPILPSFNAQPGTTAGEMIAGINGLSLLVPTTDAIEAAAARISARSKIDEGE